MLAWFPLVGCHLAKKWVPTDYFAGGGKTFCLGHLTCQEKLGWGEKVKGNGMCVYECVCTQDVCLESSK